MMAEATVNARLRLILSGWLRYSVVPQQGQQANLPVGSGI